MKILMVTMKMGIGGAETHILELCRELVRRGHAVTLVSNGGVYAELLQKEGVPHVTLPLDRKTPQSVAVSLLGLERLIRGGEFDLVHAHARIPAFLCGLLRRRLCFRFVTTAHLDFSLNPLWRRLTDWGERTMAVSDDIADYLVREYRYPREHISVTINGIDTETYKKDVSPDGFLREFGLSPDPSRRRLVYVSRLDADRADPAYRLLGAAERLAEAVPNLDLIIGGGGTEFEALSRLAQEVNRKAGRPLVTMTGARSDVARIIAAADVFVGVSRAALEAMAEEKPVILAGNQGSLGILRPEVLEAAREANFCCRGYAPATEETLVRDVTALFRESSAEREERGRWARSVIMEYYTAARMAADYEAMYRKTLLSPVPFRGAADVVISGYYGFGNLGDETLLERIAGSLAKERPGVKIAALTRHPRRDRVARGMKCLSRTGVFGILRALSGAKLLISGGGTLLQDGTSRRSLRYYAAIMGLARRLGAKVYVYANGIGPIGDGQNRALAAKRVAEADCVTVRDPDSREELIRLGVDGSRVEVTADPAFMVEPYRGERLEKALYRHGIASDRPFFAVSLRRCEGKLAQMIDEERLTEETARACAKIALEHGLTPVFVPMQPQNDEEISQKTAGRVKELAGVEAKFVEPETAPEFVGILSRAAFVVGMRLHMLIFAGCARVPVIGLSYDPKIDSVMRRLDQPYILPVTSFTAEELAACASEVLAHREEIRAVVSQRAEEMKEMCLRDVKRAARMLDD